jgi:two-component system, LytTR family, sensor histidine kinase AgrC
VSRTGKRHTAQPKLNIRRAVIVIATAGWVQIIMVLALALMFFTGNAIPSAVLLVLLIGFVLFGNYMLMRRSLGILNAEREMAEVEATLESATELNQKLRSQRHDFMNHLQVVYGLMELGDYKEACDYIDRIYKDIQSVSRLMRTDNAAINALLSAKSEEAAERHVEVEFDIRSRATGLVMEPWEFCGILGNIIDNALDALDGKPGGKIRILLWEELGGFNFAVENNGPSIPDGIAEQIFEPGFTTKGENGQGLGLHIVRETLEEHNGGVALSQTGEWIRFSGYIPKTTEVRRLDECNN